jgi:thiosulfate/3-mercaptopyruvate sulfurtransferase
MAEQSGYARPELLVETDWMESHRNDAGIRIVDCDQMDVFRRAHIPGAVGIRVDHYIKDPADSSRPMPPEGFAAMMGAMGIGDDTTVVAYDGFGSLYAARFWWLLNYYGHKNVKVLDGGWNKWLTEGRPVSIEVPEVPRATFTASANPDVICTLDQARACVGDAGVQLLDVRSDGEWTGENRRGNTYGGRVPGAAHVEWLDFVTAPPLRTFKPAHELRALLAGVGVKGDRAVVTY